jgi:hypothetical protein
MVGMAAVLFAGCSPSQPLQTAVDPSAVVLPLRAQNGQNHGGGTTLNHSVHLSGDQEPFVPATPGGPTPADSHAQGQALIRIADNELSFDYKLIASNIENIPQAHIHCGPAGVNGPIIIWLYPSPTSTAALPGGAGRHDGVLAEGTIISGATLHLRPVAATNAACPGGVATFAQALAKIRGGQAYVNVHTNDGVGAQNTGPGDFPGGEIRGQTGGKQ